MFLSHLLEKKTYFYAGQFLHPLPLSCLLPLPLSAPLANLAPPLSDPLLRLNLVLFFVRNKLP